MYSKLKTFINTIVKTVLPRKLYIKIRRIMKLLIPPQVRLIMHILDHCNLNCKGCDHFSPIAEEHFVSIEDIRKDLTKMSKMLNKSLVKEVGIMGGEPLLHPNLLEIISETRKAFPKIYIRIVTNGILLLQQNDVFWDVCKKNDVVVIVTKYPLKLDHEKMVERAKHKGVKFRFYGNTDSEIKTSHKICIDLKGMKSAEHNFSNCSYCYINVREGRMYPCPIINGFNNLNKTFGTDIKVGIDDYLEVERVKSFENVLWFSLKTKPACRYCDDMSRQNRGYDWEISNRSIDEWT